MQDWHLRRRISFAGCCVMLNIGLVHVKSKWGSHIEYYIIRIFQQCVVPYICVTLLCQSHPWFKDIVWDKLYEMEAAFKPEVNGELDTQNFMKFDEVLYKFILLICLFLCSAPSLLFSSVTLMLMILFLIPLLFHFIYVVPRI